MGSQTAGLGPCRSTLPWCWRHWAPSSSWGVVAGAAQGRACCSVCDAGVHAVTSPSASAARAPGVLSRGAAWFCSRGRCPVAQQAQLAPARAGQGARRPRTSPRSRVPPRSPGGGSPCGLHGGSVAPQRGSRRAPSPRLHLRPGTLRALPRCGGEGSRDPAPCWRCHRSPSAAARPGRPLTARRWGLPSGSCKWKRQRVSTPISRPSLASGIPLHHAGAFPSPRG